MKVLTLHQPFAWLIVKGIKPWENRPWSTLMRGPLLIHAGKSVKWWKKIDAECKRNLWSLVPANYVMGAIVGAVNITDCIPVGDLAGEPFAWGPYCMKCEGAVEFGEPIPWVGRQGFTNVDDAIVARALQLAGFKPMAPPRRRGRAA